jgi:hypothetical protein
MIGAGGRYVIDLDVGASECCFDLRAKFNDGTRRVNMGVDVCRVGSWTVGNQ